MLSLARALGCEPKFLLIDELSLGLAPLAVGRLLDGLKTTVMSRGTGVLLVEQHVRRALSVVDRGYVLGGGRIVMSGTANHLRDNMDEIEKNYLGPIERDGSGF
jgi:branched-chain amino acid transport system ATP-binding protein